MDNANTLIAALTLGLLGSAHCAGMCGGFFVMAGRRRWLRHLPYLAGKTLTYAVLGAAAGTLGAAAALFVGARTVFTVVVGVALVLAGLVWMGVLPKVVNGNPLASFVARRISLALERKGPMAPFALGLANGLLPCGLLYAAVGIAATTATPVHGAVVMTGFGLATIPGLAVFGLLAWAVGEPLVRRTHLAGGVAMVVFGVITVLRALQFHVHVM